MATRRSTLWLQVVATAAALATGMQALGANNCPGYKVFFANGINSSPVEAQESITATFALLGGTFSNSQSIYYGGIYHSNQTVGTLATAIVQKLLSDSSALTGSLVSQVVLAVIEGVPLPAWLNQFLTPAEITDLLQTAVQMEAQSTLAMVNLQTAKDIEQYTAALTLGQSVLVVAHSQGNLFANQAYDQLFASAANAKYKAAFAIAAVATPDIRTILGGPYVTTHFDQVIRAAKALAPNTLGPSDGQDFALGSGLSDWAGHNYIGVYLNPGVPHSGGQSLRSAVQTMDNALLGSLSPPVCTALPVCQPKAGASSCAVTLYDIPDVMHSGFVAPNPTTVTVTDNVSGVSSPQSYPIGVTIYDNVNGPPLNAPACAPTAPGCPPLNYHRFELCQVDGKFTPASYSSLVSTQAPLSSECTGADRSLNIHSSYSLAANGTFMGTYEQDGASNRTCTETAVDNSKYTTTYDGSDTQLNTIRISLSDGSGSASITGQSHYVATNSLNSASNFTTDTSISGNEVWGVRDAPDQLSRTGITVSVQQPVPAGQPLPQNCTAP